MKCYVEYSVIIIDISTIYNKEILKIQNTRYNMEFQILVQNMNSPTLLRTLRHTSICRFFSTKPAFTCDRYKMKRGPYANISNDHVSFFNELLGRNRVITDAEECEGYNIDYSKIVRGVLTCEAGCVLEDLDNHLATVGLMMPIDLGAKGSCLIGGCVSTNAGGLRLLRYGNLHGNILGLEAVKANGDVVDCLNTLKKNNTGYHLKHLFIGSEGTLGIVTKVAIQCPPLPAAINVAFLGLNSFDKVLKAFRLAKKELGEILSSFEMMDKLSLDVSIEAFGLKSPLTSRTDGHEFYVLMETSGSNASHDEEKLTSFVEKALADDIIEDGTLTSDPTKVKNIWALRERISEGVLREGYVFKYDISIPLPSFYKVIEVLRERLRDPRIIRISGYGHLGDGNIHVQISILSYESDIASQLQPFIFEYVSGLRGSVSAEHGIGFTKTKYLHMSRTSSEIKLMHELKRMMDPNGILNPYKVLYPLEISV
ncbi:D-2-hydroxyglutarate dehydrogenase, mitochondrial isoform X3 [Bombus vosnesenskii]|uniref:D-2-hydroxyglutarate dehydrogenase, mitochondrial n=1 Tax=Bombus vosnesenskii TaxID=207650 RepID=A0A6J3LD41_9HYME|nr:D-2-hydroxyglutarate dehydrogenase, mitochondrial isoform X3 [Bombus vosnesenskii]